MADESTHEAMRDAGALGAGRSILASKVPATRRCFWFECERFCIAPGPYSSFCGRTGDLLLGSSDHMEDDEQNREVKKLDEM